MKMMPVVRICVAVTMLAGGANAQETPSFGTTNATYIRVVPAEFNPEYSTDTYYRGSVMYATGGLGVYVAGVHLPSGALLTYFELDACDSSTDGSHVHATLYDCDAFGNCLGSALAQIYSVSNVGSPCAAFSIDLPAPQYAVNNLTHSLRLGVRMLSLGTTNELAGAVIGYKLQVSPAPAAPTFNDVPTTDPGFQFIEALSASGITSGCGGGNYCPDNPVTRRQIAIMLAKALGLSFN